MGASPSQRPRFSNATPSPNVSEVKSVCCLVFERVINGTYPFTLMLAACCSTAERFILLGVPLLKVSWPLHCAPQRKSIFYSYHSRVHISQFPLSGSTSFPLPCLVLTLNHEPRCKVAGTVAVSAGPTDHSPGPTRGRGS